MVKPKIKIALISFAICAFSFSNLQAFDMASRHSGKADVYVEMASIRQSITDLRTFSDNLFGPQAQAVIDSLTEESKELGFNPLDIKSLEKAGFNVDHSVGISAFMENKATGKTSAVVIIPASSPDTLYKVLMAGISRGITKDKEQAERAGQDYTGSQLKELKKGKTFVIQNDEMPAYFVKGSDCIVIADTLASAEDATGKVSNSIANAEYYLDLRKEFITRNKGKIPFLSVFVRPDKISELSASSSAMAGSVETINQSVLIAEMEKNLRGGGGFVNFSKYELKAQLTYLYKDGYLTDKNSMIGRLVNSDKTRLTAEYLKKTPIFFFGLRMNFPATIALLSEISTDFAKSIAEANAELSQETSLNLEEDILKAFTGSFVLALPVIPPEEQLKKVSAWDGFFSAGIDPGRRNNLEKLMNYIEQDAKKDPSAPKISKKTAGKTTLWTMTFAEGLSGSVGGKIEPESIYLLLSEDEAMLGFSSKRLELLRNLPRSGQTFQSQILKTDDEKIVSLIHVDLASIVAYIKGSSLKMMAMGYLPYLEKLSSLSLSSDISGNFATNDLILKLK
ncbi:MAG: hypothetical protein KDK41_01155 [Leptospiraceae bacterium]|nr:hypothetical protein [Leptospiraceae bacterium]